VILYLDLMTLILTFITASYADFMIVGSLHMVKRIEEDLYQRVVKIDPVYGKLYDASKQWLERDDH
jgi:hypothetical protein